MNPYWMPWMLMPIIPTMNEKPPTIYSLLESIVNYGKEDKTKIKNLAKDGRSTIFDFEYPLSDKVNKEKFECMILNHFLMRRIGFDTLTAFKIQLDVKLNEIMPLYNKMFNALDGWNIFTDGEILQRDVVDNRQIETTNSLENNSTSSGNESQDNRYSDTPQDRIEDIKNGSYVTEYKFDTRENTSEDNSSSNGTSTSNDDNIMHETTTRSPSDKIAIYKEFQENLKSIYGMIFKDLECLFYQLV